MEISHWIRLSKAPKIDLWDVVATRMIGGALIWMNTKLDVARQLGVAPWLAWQAFIIALKA